MKLRNSLRNKEKQPIILLFLVLFLTMYILTSLTPLADDDYSYCFSFYDDTRITSLAQIIPSMVVHRQMLNGRVFVHGVVQFFLMLPKIVFNVFNGLNAVLVYALIAVYLDGNGCRKAFSLACGAMALWSFLPGFGSNCLWLDGAINYAWGYSVFLLFLWPFSSKFLGKSAKKSSFFVILLHMFISFLAGSYSENASFIFLFLAACLTFMIWHQDRKAPYPLFAALIAELAGWIFLITAPASSHRSAELKLSVIGNNLAGMIKGTESYLFWFLMIDVFLLVMVSHYRGSKKIIILSILFIIGSVGSVLSFAFAAYHLPRHYCCTGFLLSFSLVLCINEMLFLKQHLSVKLLACYLAVLFAFRFSLGTLDIVVCWHKAQEREHAICAAIEAGERSVTVENCVPMTKYALQFHLNDDNPNEWPNIAVSSYYGIEEIYGKEPNS